MALSVAEVIETIINTKVRKTQGRSIADFICNKNVNLPY